MKVASNDFIAIHVYPFEVFQPHHLPHCHVRWKNGEAVVALPTLRLIVGKRLPKGGKELLLSHFNDICKAWNKLNPELIINE